MIQSSLLHTGTSEIEEYITENELLIKYLSTYDQQSGKQCQYARQAYKQYKEVQAILSGRLPPENIPKLSYNIRHKKYRTQNRWRLIKLRECKCELCGNPLKESLEVHHRHLMSEGGTNEEDNLISVCASCHKVIHACIDQGGISDTIRDYYGEVIELLESLVETGIGGGE